MPRNLTPTRQVVLPADMGAAVGGRLAGDGPACPRVSQRWQWDGSAMAGM